MSRRQLLRDARVVIVYEGRSYSYTAASAISLETSFTEVSGRRKTLHKKTSKKYSVISGKSETSFTLNTLATESRTEELFFQLLGFSQGPTHFMPEDIAVSPKFFDVYIINSETTVKLSPCFLETLDVNMSKSTALSFSVTISCGGYDFIEGLAFEETKPQGLPMQPTPIYLQIGDEVYNNIVNASFSIQQAASWRSDKSLFDAGMYSYKRAVLEDLIVSATITNNLDTGTFLEEPVLGDFTIQQSALSLTIPKASIIPRTTVASIYQNNLDISPVEESGDVVIQYGEHNETRSS